MIARLFYGYLGGYRQKAKNLKGPEKRVGNKILWTGTVIFFFFYLQYLGSVFYSSEITTKYLSQSIYDYALKTEESVNQTFVSQSNTGWHQLNKQQLDAGILRRPRIREVPYRQSAGRGDEGD